MCPTTRGPRSQGIIPARAEAPRYLDMLFDPQKLLLIAGPCSLETEKVTRTVAEALVKLAKAQPDVKIIFKGSYDKANRTSLAGDRGTGMEAGLALLAMVKK